MARSVGNLAIIISGNAKPLMGALASAKSHVSRFQNSANRALRDRALPGGGAGLLARHPLVQPPSVQHLAPNRSAINAAGLRYQSFGRFAQSLFIKGFGGGIIGGFVGIFGYSFVQSVAGAIGFAGRTAAQFFSSALQEGIDLTRLQISLKFLAQDAERATSWLQQMFELSAGSGFGIDQLGRSFQTIAGQTGDLEQVPNIMRAITEISAGLGLDAERMNRLALAIGQVAAAGRFEGQEILQLTESIPIKHFAETAGISIGEFRKRMKEGTLEVNILWETLNRLALSPSGAFFGKMDDFARSAVGQVAQLNQNWKLLKITVGQGLLEELKDQNVLSAINQGFQWMLSHKDEVKGFLHDMVAAFKQLAITTVRWAGIIYDAFMFIQRNAKLIGRGLQLVSSPVAAISMEIRKNTFGGPFHSDTGERWAQMLADAFERDFVPRAQRSMEQIMPRTFKDGPLVTLSGEAAKFVDQIGGSLKTGSPFGEFQNAIKLSAEAQKFHTNEWNRKRDDLLREIVAAKQIIDNPAADPAMIARFQEQLFAAQQKLLAIGPNQFGAGEAEFARAQAFLKLEESLGRITNEFPKAMERGSVEAASAINKALFSRPEQSIQERINKGIERGNKIAEQQKDFLKNIDRALKNNPAIKAIGF